MIAILYVLGNEVDDVMSIDYAPKYVFVTGASSGIGHAVANRLHEQGYHVLAGVRQIPEFSKLEDRFQYVIADITNNKQVSDAALEIKTITGEFGLHGLVNAAGIVIDGPIELITVDDFRRQLEVNVIGRFAITRSLLSSLRQGKARVVNIGAISGRLTVPFFGCPAIASTAFAALNDSMRMEFAPFGIKVTLIEPSAIKTDIFNKAERAQSAALKLQPQNIVKAYEASLHAVKKVFSKAQPDDPEIVVDVVLRVFHSRWKSRSRILVGRGARMLSIVGILPVFLRDPLIMQIMQLRKPLAKTASDLKTV